MIEEGQQFPSFSLQDQNGRTWSNHDLLGQRTIMYFYPKDDTPGCTVEAWEFQSVGSDLARKNAASGVVFGVSPDSVKSHQKFASKFHLDFPLLSDVNHLLADALGIWAEKTLYGRKYMAVARTTYVIGAEGRIEKIYLNVQPAGHAKEIVQSMFV